MDTKDLLAERAKTHGSFEWNASAYCGMKQAFRDGAAPLQFKHVHSLAIDMIFVKLARLRQNPTCKDHWDDIAGYAKLGSEACE